MNHKSLHTNSSNLEKLTYLPLFNNSFITIFCFDHDEIDRFKFIEQEEKIIVLHGKLFDRSFTNTHQFVKCVLGTTFVTWHRKLRTTVKLEWLKKLSKTAALNWNLSNMPNWISHLLIQIYIFYKFNSKKGIKYKNRKQTECLNALYKKSNSNAFVC